MIVFNLSCAIFEEFNSIEDAAKFVKSSTSEIYSFLKGKRGAVKGFKFKKRSPDGRIIEPPLFIPFVRPPKKVIVRNPPIPPMSVVQYDLSGNELRKFQSLREVSLHLGVKKHTFKKTIQRSPTGYYKGHTYKLIKPQPALLGLSVCDRDWETSRKD